MHKIREQNASEKNGSAVYFLKNSLQNKIKRLFVSQNNFMKKNNGITYNDCLTFFFF